MWPAINRRLKRSAPGLHALLKRRAASWRDGAMPLVPVPKWVAGEFFWSHPRLLTVDTRDHEPHICRWILAHLPSGGVFCDVGAHCGWLSMKAARHAGPRGRIVAFEASPVLCQILEYHKRVNRLPQITVVAKAVSDRESKGTPFYLINGGFSFRNSLTIGGADVPYVSSAAKSSVEVPALTLDRYCETACLAPSVIKIDVEGAEVQVLRGAAEILRRTHPALIVSMHPFWIPPPDSAAGALAFLSQWGYSVKAQHVVEMDGYEVADYLLTI
jgi:FkbM family methyltransferase